MTEVTLEVLGELMQRDRDHPRIARGANGRGGTGPTRSRIWRIVTLSLTRWLTQRTYAVDSKSLKSWDRGRRLVP